MSKFRLDVAEYYKKKNNNKSIHISACGLSVLIFLIFVILLFPKRGWSHKNVSTVSYTLTYTHLEIKMMRSQALDYFTLSLSSSGIFCPLFQ